MTKTETLELNKPDASDFYDIAVQNSNMDILDTAFQRVESHITDKSNPHSVTKGQVGLGNVPNVATNDQTPTYTSAGQLTELSSGEKISVAFGKISKAISSLISHLSSTNNPHAVTAGQVGLGNVPNVATNNQTPTYTVASNNTALVSGENMSTAFGKIARAISSLISHLANTSNPHSVTASQAGAVPATETNSFNFTNKSLNTVNIDEVTGYNYITAISEGGHGTRPWDGWSNVINFWSSHFVTQIAFTCTASTTVERNVRMWIRERYMSESQGWSEWKSIHNSSTITAGTVDLTAGTSPLETGKIYLVYE